MECNSKLLIYFKPIGNAHILKVNKYRIEPGFTFRHIRLFLENLLLLKDDDPLFIYITDIKTKKTIKPKSIDNLKHLFSRYSYDNKLIINYSYQGYPEPSSQINQKDLPIAQYQTDILIQNIYTIGKIKENERLISDKNGLLKVETEDLLQGIRRWYLGRNRNEVIFYLGKVLQDAFYLLNKQDCKEHLINTLKLGLKKMIKGIDNFKITYNKDIGMCFQLENFKSNINKRLE